MNLVFLLEGDKPMCLPTGQSKALLFPRSDTAFLARMANVEIEFLTMATPGRPG
jgi:hypothetical protein